MSLHSHPHHNHTRMKLILILLLSPLLAHAEYNKLSKSQCTPVDNHVEGVRYCTERIEGWFRGGALDLWSSMNNLDTCYKGGSQCECNDCGDAFQSCQENRCHDTEGYLKWNEATKENECLTIGTNRKRDSGENWFDYCYRSSKACDKSVCTKGQYLSGCMRVSPGTCKSCPVAVTVGTTYWGAVGSGVASCTLIACSVPKAGEYTKAACTSNTNAEIKSCSEYPGNKESKNNLSAEQKAAIAAGQKGVFDIDRYYCPAGNVILPLPANSIAINGYTEFQCKSGFYLFEGACLQCSPGSACVFGQQYPCPVNYYSKTIGSSSCTLCTSVCISKNKRPLRCQNGSTYDAGCVSCGACGYTADVGLSCVDNNYEMQQLDKYCSPSSTGEWLCKAKNTIQ